MPRILIAVLAVLALAVASACDDGDTPEPEPSSIRIGAPADCRLNAFCAPGLAREYGADATQALVDVEAGAPMQEALAGGAIEVGVFFSTDPIPESNDWLRLEDDKGMVGADNIVPVLKQSSADVLGADGVALLNRVSATLTSEQLKALVGAVEIAGNEPAALAETWVDNNLPEVPTLTLDRAFNIHTSSFTESVVVGELYAAALRRAGIEVIVVRDGPRIELINNVVFGDVDLIPEFAASALRFVSGGDVIATSVRDETVATLREYLAVRDLVALEPSDAVSTNTFVVTRETAERLGLATLSDLAEQLPTIDVEPVEPPDPGEVPPGSGPDDLGVGSSGEAVVRLQLQLTALFYNPGPADGVFGEQTRRAVVQFQENQGLVPDGVVGPATQARLDEELAAAFDEARATPTAPPPLPTLPPPPPPVPTIGGGGGGSGDRVLYLTFDDGPHPTFTPQILDVLDRYSAKATFYAIGQQIGGQPAIISRMIAGGHSLQNHTWDHPDLAGMSQDAFNAQINAATDAVVAAGAPRPNCLRPPFGSTDANTRPWAQALGLGVVLWDIDTQDWRQPGAGVISSHVINNAFPGATILFHDGGGDRSQTVAALDTILSTLGAQGYRFEASCLS